MAAEVVVEKDLLPYPFGSPRDILTALFRQKLKILLVFIAIFSGITAWVYTQPTLFSAHAAIILKFGREHIFRPEVGDVNQIVRFNENAAVESERKILESTDLLRRAVIAIGVETLYPDIVGSADEVNDKHITKATGRMMGKLTSKAGDDSNVIEINFLHEVPKVAALTLNVLIELLKEKHLQVFSDPKASFLVQRLDEYQKDLESGEKALQAFKQQNDLSSPIADQQRRFLDQRAVLDTNHKTINNKLQGLRGKVTSLEAQMKTVPETIPLSTTEAGGMLDKAKADLFSLKRQEQGLLAKYTETSSPVQKIRKEMELIEEFIKNETNSEGAKSVTSGKNPIFQNLEVARLTALSEVKTLQESDKVIVGQIQDLDQKIQRLDLLQEKLVGLERTKATAEENYNLYVKKVEEAKVSEEMDQLKMSNISVIQAAEIPSMPAGRPKLIKLILGAIFAGMVSVGLAFVFEFLQGGYTRPDQAAEDLDLPILATFTQKG